MINGITSAPVIKPFKGPLESWKYTPLEEHVLGGSAIGDGAAGREVQTWKVTYDGTSILVAPLNGSTAFNLTVPGVLTVSLAFDSNMAVALAYQTLAASNLYYFNAVDSAYETKVILGGSSCRVCVDDSRQFDSAASDVIFGYIKDDKFYIRQQRDRYLMERLIGDANGGQLLKMGPSVGLRWQAQIEAIS